MAAKKLTPPKGMISKIKAKYKKAMQPVKPAKKTMTFGSNPTKGKKK